MYGTLLQIHSVVRWLVLLGIIITLLRAYWGLIGARPFTKGDRVGVAMATMASHTQLLIGFALYFSSPFVALFWSKPEERWESPQVIFFSLIHIAGMVTSVVLMTIGSSLMRRAEEDRRKFRVLAIYWSIALGLILLLIPWPFSPLAQRPLWRPF